MKPVVTAPVPENNIINNNNPAAANISMNLFILSVYFYSDTELGAKVAAVLEQLHTGNNTGGGWFLINSYEKPPISGPLWPFGTLVANKEPQKPTGPTAKNEAFGTLLCYKSGFVKIVCHRNL